MWAAAYAQTILAGAVRYYSGGDSGAYPIGCDLDACDGAAFTWPRKRALASALHSAGWILHTRGVDYRLQIRPANWVERRTAPDALLPAGLSAFLFGAALWTGSGVLWGAAAALTLATLLLAGCLHNPEKIE